MADDKYILDENHNAVNEPDLLKWARWFEAFDRTVQRTNVGPYRVSTVFLGLDHNFARIVNPNAPPLLFETMVFDAGGDVGAIQDRCSTWDESLAQHERVVEIMRMIANG